VSNSKDEDHAPASFPATYFVIAHVFAWTFWLFPLASTHGWISSPRIASLEVAFLVVGAFGPLVASFYLTYRDGGRRALLQFAGRALRIRIPAGPLCVALLLLPALAALAVYLHSREGGPALLWAMPFPIVVVNYLLLFFLGGSLQEEFGWAYAIDCMQQKWPLPWSSMLLGVIWGFWHLPLFFIPGLSQTFLPLWTFLLMTISLRVLMVWVYHAAQRSVLATLLFHTSLNFSLNAFPVVARSKNAFPRTWLYFVLLLCVSSLPVIWRQLTAKPSDARAAPRYRADA
jgi:uncharacterized protein